MKPVLCSLRKPLVRLPVQVFFFPPVENNGFSTGQQIGERSQIFLDANAALNYLVLMYSRVWCKRPDDAG